MAFQPVVLGTVPGDKTGDNLRTGGDKINDNFLELYGVIADPQLVAIAALTPAANQVIYWTSSTAAAMTSLTSFGRTLIASADNTAARTSLGLGSIATQAANSVTISGGTIASLTSLGVGGSAGSYKAGITGNGSGLGLNINATGSNTSSPALALVDGTVNVVAGPHSASTYGFIGTFTNHDFLIVRQNVERARFTAQGITVAGSLKSSSYTVATVPSASTHGAGAIIYVSNEAGGAVPAFSDATDWRRVTDRAVIS